MLLQSLIGKAICYVIGQRLNTYRYIDDGCAPIDNRLIERDIIRLPSDAQITRPHWLPAACLMGK